MTSWIMPMRFLKRKYDRDADTLLRRVHNTPVCDFCAETPPVSIYGATRMTTGEFVDCWRWCACQACEHLIDANKWDEFVDRVSSKLREQLPSGIPTEVATHSVWAALSIFFRDAARITEPTGENKERKAT